MCPTQISQVRTHYLDRIAGKETEHGIHRAADEETGLVDGVVCARAQKGVIAPGIAVTVERAAEA